MSPGQLACQAPSITPQQPPTLGEFFGVDQATGDPTPPFGGNPFGSGSLRGVPALTGPFTSRGAEQPSHRTGQGAIHGRCRGQIVRKDYQRHV